jgi:cytochrome c oxidase cbb3-type subunit 3
MKKLLISLLALVPFMSLAQESEQKASAAGVSDEVILWVLIGFGVFQLIVLKFAVDVLVSLKGQIKNQQINKKVFGIIVLLVFSSNTFAATPQPGYAPFKFTPLTFWGLVALNLAIFSILWYVVRLIKGYTRVLKGEAFEEDETFLQSIYKKLVNKPVAIEDEESITTDHVYDGIRELDNSLPPWWLYGFYFTIVFSVVYLIHFHVSAIPGLDKLVIIGPVEKGTQAELYELEMAQAAAEKEAFLATQANLVDESSVEKLTDATSLSEGKSIFTANCVACHGNEGQGGVGPNLTDEFWIHGGGIKNIFKTIKYGVPEKGMIPWETQLTPQQIQQVASFVLSLQGTKPANPKAPEGEKWTDKTNVETDNVLPDSTQATTIDSSISEG